MKVYVATAGEYSDYHIASIFRNKEDAEAYAAVLQDGRVEEYELHEAPVERRTWHTFSWRADGPDEEPDSVRMGNPWEYSEPRDFDGNPHLVEHWWRTERAVSEAGPFDMRILCIAGWDRDRILKVYSEQRAQELARREGIS